MIRFSILSAALLFMAFVPLTADAESYSWKGKDGRTYYGSKPPKGAKSVSKLKTPKLSRYSSNKMLTRLGYDKSTVSKRADAADVENRAETIPFETSPGALEQGELSVEHDEQNQVTACKLQVKNESGREFGDISVAFEFPDGTLVPGVGPDTIAPSSAAEYFVPDELLPIAIASPTGEATDEKPMPKIMIHGTGRG